MKINYFAINKDMEKRLPQLYQTKMKICYEQGYIDIIVVTAKKSLSILLFFVACSRLRDSWSAKLRKRGDLYIRAITTIWDFFGTSSFFSTISQGSLFLQAPAPMIVKFEKNRWKRFRDILEWNFVVKNYVQKKLESLDVQFHFIVV